MNLQQSSLVYKSVPPKIVSPAGKTPVLILIHGRGTDENDLLGLAPFLDERFMILSVRAPLRYEFGGFAWFHLSDSKKPDSGSLHLSYELLNQFVDEVRNADETNEGKIFLMGFSMGAMMSYLLALTAPEKFAGVAAQSGFAIELPEYEYRWQKLDHCPFVITHGTEDPVIPVSLARRTKGLFKGSNAEVTYLEYPMGHQISEESLTDVSEWLRKKLG
jgi:phospholipase/carboxylesterase